ncbi:glycosyltransferase [Mesorhizobium australicum WSM2073]|uniref:Glycosyltransferase n=1 Tax=Mesorhizobium australicum (strain HAMBI 3006 / LMG 24608 / WSM2073) TaxID=754035 RepID=L0KRP9_MESAW|nr:glycosyltransferase [Mesorhizobium australicum]AGB47340.1 glycosyltransferase [Mesorhizobium australicum WSM2073]
MRIVIDMQGAQATNAKRGIGRYVMAFVEGLVRNRRKHEIILALNGAFSDSAADIRTYFSGLLPAGNIRTWIAPGPVAGLHPEYTGRRKAAELLREAFLASLEPDVIVVSSLFEGCVDDAATSVGLLPHSALVATILFDLIPLLNRDPYLANPAVASWYESKLDHLRRSNLLLAISESSRREAIQWLNFSHEEVVTISAAVDNNFRPLQIEAAQETALRRKYRLTRPFLMYTGGIDHRKNIPALIQAFGKLPRKLRKDHQLAIVCSVEESARAELLETARLAGIPADGLVLTGFIPQKDLVALYNLCALFVFPSWHEGFGLPLLEAMKCGAPVIGANRSSLPEVIGFERALFDPFSVPDMAARMEQALSDADFRSALVSNAAERAKLFSWDATSCAALDSLEKLHVTRSLPAQSPAVPLRRPKLAYLSPLPPSRSGIADYSAELLPELARHYEIDVIVDQPHVDSPWVNANSRVYSSTWFAENAHRYDRVLYHFGNSPFHGQMFALLKQIPGVVVLHDFFLSGIQSHLEFFGGIPGAWSRSLYESHGFEAVRHRFCMQDTAETAWKYPCNFELIRDSLGIIGHSHHSKQLALEHCGEEAARRWSYVPLLRAPVDLPSRDAARKRLSIPADEFVTCSFGMLTTTKLGDRLLAAWTASRLGRMKDSRLVFVGESPPSEFDTSLRAAIRGSGAGRRVSITGWTNRETYRDYLAAADMAVQLRGNSRGETSAAILDCLAAGLPTIVNANGSAAELDDRAVRKLKDGFGPIELSEALDSLWESADERKRLGQQGQAYLRANHTPRLCADRYADTIEKYYQQDHAGLGGLVGALAQDDCYGLELTELAADISVSIAVTRERPSLFIDITYLRTFQLRTGIQRVVRSVLNEWLAHPNREYRIEPIFLSDGQFFHAKRYTAQFVGGDENAFEDDPVNFRAGDIFLGLDLNPDTRSIEAAPAFHQMRLFGVKIVFVIYDILPVLHPEWWPAGGSDTHRAWLVNSLVVADQLVTISKAVTDDVEEFFAAEFPTGSKKPEIGHFHLGANIGWSDRTSGLPDSAAGILDAITGTPTFLMVGTIEPRKGYGQVLDAFDILWSEGASVNLVIVGTQGWMTEVLVDRMQLHPENGKRLFWLNSVSDEYLERLYATSACLLAASEGEGFGLPLIEAAQHRLPIIARNISVFREVAGDHAYYFVGLAGADLADSVREWLTLFRSRRHPRSENMPWLTWAQSARQLLDLVLADGVFPAEAEPIARKAN